MAGEEVAQGGVCRKRVARDLEGEAPGHGAAREREGGLCGKGVTHGNGVSSGTIIGLLFLTQVSCRQGITRSNMEYRPSRDVQDITAVS